MKLLSAKVDTAGEDRLSAIEAADFTSGFFSTSLKFRRPDAMMFRGYEAWRILFEHGTEEL